MDVARRSSAVSKFDPAATALQIHSLEAMEKVAERAKDAAALEAAVVQKLEAQRDFAAGYRAANPPGGDQSARSGVLADDYCSRFGFALRTVQRWCERLLDDSSFQVEKHERLAKVWRILEMEQAANYSSESVGWYTPKVYLEAARQVMGGIDLDPASSVKANETVKATEFYSDGGLERDWFGRVWLNPPYGRCEDGRSMASAFCDKAITEVLSGRVLQAIVLVNSVHSQKWQQPLLDASMGLCLVDHRIEFVSADGQPNENPTFQNIFVNLAGDSIDDPYAAFYGGFRQFGQIFSRVHF